MLKKLRLRFVCVLMAIVTVTLCLMFGLVYHFTRENLESQALSMMESVVEDPLQLGRPNSRSQEMKRPISSSRSALTGSWWRCPEAITICPMRPF